MWTEEQIEKLIGLYKEQPMLWDPAHKNYKNRHRKQEALQSISSAMNVEAVDVERKINVLVTQFRRTHRKVLERKKSGMVGDDVEKNLWYGYKMLMFLEDRFNNSALFLKSSALQNQQTQNNGQAGQPPISRPSGAIQYPSLPNILPKVTTRPLNEAIVLMNNVPGKRQVDKDEYDYYGEQIACKLRKMDEITRINTQHRINCIIHETEMKMVNKRYGFSSAVQTVPSPSSSPVPRQFSPEPSVVSYVDVNEIPGDTKTLHERTTIKTDED